VPPAARPVCDLGHGAPARAISARRSGSRIVTRERLRFTAPLRSSCRNARETSSRTVPSRPRAARGSARGRPRLPATGAGRRWWRRARGDAPGARSPGEKPGPRRGRRSVARAGPWPRAWPERHPGGGGRDRERSRAEEAEAASAPRRRPRRHTLARRRAAPRRGWRPRLSAWSTCSRPRGEIWRISTAPSAMTRRPGHASPASKACSPRLRARERQRRASASSSLEGSFRKYAERLRAATAPLSRHTRSTMDMACAGCSRRQGTRGGRVAEAASSAAGAGGASHREDAPPRGGSLGNRATAASA
jgi:hypothetical protein